MRSTKIARTLVVTLLTIAVVSTLSLGYFGERSAITDSVASENFTDDGAAILPSSTNELKELPYYTDLRDDLLWMISNLQDNTSVEYSGLFYSEVDENGVLLNGNHNTEDYMHYIGGAAQLIVPVDNIRTSFFNFIKESPAYQPSESSEDGRGFYTWSSEDFSTNSSVKEAVGNILPIVYYADLCTDPDLSEFNSFGASDLIMEQWNILNNLLYDTTNGGYNHSTSSGIKITRDQLIAAIAGFMLGRCNIEVTTQIKNEANTRAINLMTNLITNQVYDDDMNSFESARGVSFGTTYDNSKDLETNAWGIMALLNWYLNVDQSNSAILNRSIDIYNFLENRMWNETYNLYMTQTDAIGNLQNQTMSLKANAVMLLSLIDLFEITGNFSYFEKIQTLYQSIKTNFRDVDGYYYNTVGYESSTSKSVGGFSLYCRGLDHLTKLANNAIISLELNDTYVIIDEEFGVNVTSTYAINVNRTYLGVTTLVNQVEVENADLTFNIHNPQGDLIQTVTEKSDENGTHTFNFTLPANSPYGVYHISAYGNYSGLATAFNQITFDYMANVSMSFVDFTNDLACGVNKMVNVSMVSKRTTDLNVSVVTKGENFETIKKSGVIIENKTTSYVESSIVPKVNAKFGTQVVTVQLINGTHVIHEQNFTVNVKSPVKLLQTREPIYGFIGEAFNVTFSFENMRNQSEEIKISIYGDYITPKTFTATLASMTSQEVESEISLVNEIPMTSVSYFINITRGSDDQVIHQDTKLITIKQAIEILEVISSESYPQGHTPQITLKIQNNYRIITPVQIRFGDTTKTVNLLPGVNFITVKAEHALLNPYKFGDGVLKMQVLNMNEVILYEESIYYMIEVSPTNLVLAYFLPAIIPIVGIAIVKHRALENKKRLA